jgi:hypothetical protein
VRRAFYAFIAIIILAFAIGLPAYLVFGAGGGGSNVTIAVTATPLVEAPPPGGGGGGGGAAGCPAGTTSCTGRISNTGRVSTTIFVNSPDAQFRLTINEGTVARNADGSPLNCIGINKTESLPSPPAGAYIISIWYGVTPDEATFSPSATLQYTYAPGTVPAGTDGQKLVIAYHNKANDEWITLPSVVDTQTNTVTAGISRWGDLAVFGYTKEAPPPAAFQVSSLGFSPAAVYTGELVNITILVANSGGQSGSYQVALKINGVAEATKEIIIGAGASQQVSFSVSKEAAGSYSVDVNGLTGAFEVNARPVLPPPVKPFNWWIIVGITATIALAALLTYTFRVQKKHGGISGVLSWEFGVAISLTPKLATKVMAAVRSLLKKTKSIKSKLKKTKSIKPKSIKIYKN